MTRQEMSKRRDELVDIAEFAYEDEQALSWKALQRLEREIARYNHLLISGLTTDPIDEY